MRNYRKKVKSLYSPRYCKKLFVSKSDLIVPDHIFSGGKRRRYRIVIGLEGVLFCCDRKGDLLEKNNVCRCQQLVGKDNDRIGLDEAA